MIKKKILLLVSAVLLVLFATFIYSNNDLAFDQIREAVDSELTKLPVKDLQTNPTDNLDETELDTVFSQVESADNFDDLVE